MRVSTRIDCRSRAGDGRVGIAALVELRFRVWMEWARELVSAAVLSGAPPPEKERVPSKKKLAEFATGG